MHSNPDAAPLLDVLTYNVNGLKDYNKSKRIINKFLKASSKQATVDCTIICLQETHLQHLDLAKFSNRWRFGNAHSINGESTRGVAVLWFDHQWDECLGSESDLDGRIVSVTLQKNNETYSFISIYAPVLSSGESVTFCQNIQDFVLGLQNKYPTTHIFIAGDFNHTTDHNDYTSRKVSPAEITTRTAYKNLFDTFQLTDSYRSIHERYGYTWGYKNRNRISGLSRIDRVMAPVSQHISVISSSILPEFDSSDHALLKCVFTLPLAHKQGPGYFKLHQSTYQSDYAKTKIKGIIEQAMQSSSYYTDNGLRWDFIKCFLRSELMVIQKQSQCEFLSALSACEHELDSLHIVKAQLPQDSTCFVTKIRNRILSNEIRRLTVEVNTLRELESKDLIARSRAKWAEEGEKSNKYFLNLIKIRKSKSRINKIMVNGATFTNPKDILTQITSFYKQLYNPSRSLNSTVDNTSSFLENCPRLNPADCAKVEAPLTLGDLIKSLNTMKDSAPGPDGFPYSFYKTFASLLLPMLLNSWNSCVQKGHLTADARTSFITLIPKPNKDPTNINNLRPL